MIYLFHLLDKPASGELRTRLRPEHKKYLGQVADRIAFAGPLFAEEGDGGAMIGSVLAIDFENAQAASDWLGQEPFTQAGLYQTSRIDRFDNLWPQKTGFPPT